MKENGGMFNDLIDEIKKPISNALDQYVKNTRTQRPPSFHERNARRSR